jgi:hypothetical protein
MIKPHRSHILSQAAVSSGTAAKLFSPPTTTPKIPRACVPTVKRHPTSRKIRRSTRSIRDGSRIRKRYRPLRRSDPWSPRPRAAVSSCPSMAIIHPRLSTPAPCNIAWTPAPCDMSSTPVPCNMASVHSRYSHLCIMELSKTRIRHTTRATQPDT